MLGRKKAASSEKKSKRSQDSHQQLLGMGLVPGLDDNEDDDDADLEAELQNLMFGGSKATKPKKRKSVQQPDLDQMVAACMADIPDDDDDDDLNDDELLNELAEFEEPQEENPPPPPRMVAPLQPPSYDSNQQCAGQSLLSVIDSRLETYALAEKKAKSTGETSKARRFSRGLATLTDLRRKVKSGKAVDENDIPPLLAPSLYSSATANEEKPPLPAAVEPLQPQKTSLAPSEPVQDPLLISQLQEKRSLYKEYALNAKKEGDKQAAMLGLAGVKQCDEMMQSAKSGEKVQLNLLPSLPTLKKAAAPPPPAVERSFSRDAPLEIPENPDDIPPPKPEVYGAPPPAKTADEALKQRLEKYRQDEAKAKAEGNTSRARRLGRICKQYEEAIVLHKKGKLATVLADLPCPPGFAPIPTGGGETGATQQPPPAVSTIPPAGSQAPKVAPAKKPLTLQEKQILDLEKRQNQFKSAALSAKKAGQIEQAKEYLRKAKGFDSLIDAARSGLPVDFKSLPVAPQAQRGNRVTFIHANPL